MVGLFLARETSLELNGHPQRAGRRIWPCTFVELDLLAVEDHIAALHPSILNVVAHHVEGVTVRDEERRVLARL